MDHSLPFLTLVIEFLFLSGTPFVARHFLMAGIIGWIYMIFNMIYTLKTGIRIYAPFKWDSVGQFVGIYGGFTIGGAFVFFMAYFLAKFKLRKLGHIKIYNVLYGSKKDSNKGLKQIIE